MTSWAGRWLADYRRMLKGPELEEPFDVWLYRPLAYLLVKAIAPTPITPNQVTAFNLLPGLAAAWCYWQGTPGGYLAGAVLLFATNVIDCVDGMLARVRGAGTVTGYILDGLADYIIQVSLFVALLHGVAVTEGDPWLSLACGVPAGLVFAWWCARLDLLRGEWLARVHGRRRDPHAELAALRREAEQWRRQGGHHLERALVGAFGIYVRLWYRGGDSDPATTPDEPLAEWMCRKRPVLRMAVLMGPSTHITLIVIAGLLARPLWYLWTALVLGAFWGAMVLGLQAVRERGAWSGLPEEMVLQVLLLAAGQATRLRPLTDDRPKCLLEVGGRPIVSRAVAQLLSRGLRQITIVDGYRGDMIRATLTAEFPDVAFRFIRNEDYATTNNAWSMHLAEALPPGPLMLLDSDIVFDTGVLDLLLAHPAPSRLALRTRGEIGHEEMKVVLDGAGLVRALGKELEPSAAAGESVGIEVFAADFVAALWPVLRRRLHEEQRVGEYYEDAFLELIGAGWPVAAVDIGALACREIDTVADLEAARTEFSDP